MLEHREEGATRGEPCGGHPHAGAALGDEVVDELAGQPGAEHRCEAGHERRHDSQAECPGGGARIQSEGDPEWAHGPRASAHPVAPAGTGLRSTSMVWPLMTTCRSGATTYSVGKVLVRNAAVTGPGWCST